MQTKHPSFRLENKTEFCIWMHFFGIRKSQTETRTAFLSLKWRVFGVSVLGEHKQLESNKPISDIVHRRFSFRYASAQIIIIVGMIRLNVNGCESCWGIKSTENEITPKVIDFHRRHRWELCAVNFPIFHTRKKPIWSGNVAVLNVKKKKPQHRTDEEKR